MTVALAAPPTLGDGTVTLRPVDGSVASLLVAGSHDPEVTRWTQVPEGLSMLEAGLVTAGWAYPSERIVRFQVCLADIPAAGVVSVWFNASGTPEVGYWLLAEARGRGAGTAAVRLVCAWALDTCGFPLLQLTTLPGNIASETVADRCGFAAVGTVDRDIKGTMRTLRVWTRSRGVPV